METNQLEFPREWVSHSPEETEAIAGEIARLIRPGQVIRLTGDLGAGKTCLSRGLVAALGGDPDLVNSPSFTLVQEYPTPAGIIYHWDLYRLSPTTDWSVLDLPEHLADPVAITLIEWPDRYPGPWPTERTLSIQLQQPRADPDTRAIRLTR